MAADALSVRDLMTTRVMTIGMDDSLRTARQMFREHKFHHLVVVEGGKPVGVISDRDLLKHISPFVNIRLGEHPRDLATLNKRIHQMMTRELVSIRADRPAAEAARLMIDRGISCLPVIDEQQTLLGIVTTRDMLRWLVGSQLNEAGWVGPVTQHVAH